MSHSLVDMIDTIIIGAGPSGLCAAKTLLQYDPDSDILILDKGSSLGGVWAKERIYPTLKTNNLRGGIDFSDLLLDEKFGVKAKEHIPGEVMHAYLCAYADKFHVTDKIRFNTEVVEVRRGGKEDENNTTTGEREWVVEVEGQEQGGREMLACKKLIVATGILSAPHMPTIKGAKDDFDAPFLHSSEFGTQAQQWRTETPDNVLNDPAIQHIAVLGGGKSAYDAVYLACKTGHKVDWIIRKSGRGPAWVFPPYTYLGPFKAWKERLATRRIFSFMSPWVFPDFSGWSWLRRFLHFTPLGKIISDGFLGTVHRDTIRDVGYETDPRFKILQPEAHPFWYGTQSGTLSFDTDFFDLIRNGQVTIHREDITHLSAHTIHLANGDGLPADALIAATGFSSKPTITFSPPSLHAELGLPSTSLTHQQQATWTKLDRQADHTIAAQFPRLVPSGSASLPSASPYSKPKQSDDPQVTYTPWRLYRGIAPPGLAAQGDRSLVFLGMFSNITGTTRLEIQCLWALAYLTNHLDSQIPSGEAAKDVFRETALWQRWAQHRTPYGHGKFYPDLVFDQVPYWDLLLNDLGLETRRKGGLRELFAPYTFEDYKGIVDEWVGMSRR